MIGNKHHFVNIGPDEADDDRVLALAALRVLDDVHAVQEVDELLSNERCCN